MRPGDRAPGLDQSHALAARVAYMVYVRRQPQKAVAAALGISEAKVSRRLAEAWRENFIEVRIRHPVARCLELETELVMEFNLREAHVVPAVDVASRGLKKALGLEGAEVLKGFLSPGTSLGVSWGSTVSEVVTHLDCPEPLRVQVVQLNGSLSLIPVEFDSKDLVGRLARSLGGTYHFLHVEGIVDNPEIRRAVVSDSKIQDTFARHREVRVALVGIGALTPVPTSTLVYRGYLRSGDMDQLRRARAVGDIVLRFYDEEGRPCQTAVDDRVVAISHEAYRRIPVKLAVAGGLDKAMAIRGALRGGLVDVLVTDEETACSVLSGP